MNTENKSLQRLQQTNLEMIKIFIQICAKHQLQYFALGGTLLGAVRHQGFIPWDDDVDLGMPRPDYEKFLQIAPDELANLEPQGRYRLRTIDVDDDYRTYIAKIENVDVKMVRQFYTKDGVADKQIFAWIDVMPIDGMPADEAQLLTHNANILKAKKKVSLTLLDKNMGTSKKRSKKEMLIINAGLKTGAFKLLNVKKAFEAFDNLCKKYSYDESCVAGNTYGVYKEKEFVEKSIFGGGSFYPFEDMQIRCPKDADAYLKHVYGDYMQLPPEEARGGHEITFAE